MKDKVIEILSMPKSTESIKALCELCSIREFQANNIIDEYKKLYEFEVSMLNKGMDPSNFSREKQLLIRNLTSMEYAKEEVILRDLKSYIVKLLQMPINEESIKSLSNLCKIDLLSSKSFIEKYQEIVKNEDELIMYNKDTSLLTSQKMKIIDELIKLGI